MGRPCCRRCFPWQRGPTLSRLSRLSGLPIALSGFGQGCSLGGSWRRQPLCFGPPSGAGGHGAAGIDRPRATPGGGWPSLVPRGGEVVRAHCLGRLSADSYYSNHSNLCCRTFFGRARLPLARPLDPGLSSRAAASCCSRCLARSDPGCRMGTSGLAPHARPCLGGPFQRRLPMASAACVLSLDIPAAVALAGAVSRRWVFLSAAWCTPWAVLDRFRSPMDGSGAKVHTPEGRWAGGEPLDRARRSTRQKRCASTFGRRAQRKVAVRRWPAFMAHCDNGTPRTGSACADGQDETPRPCWSAGF